jgi:hypothetical protein
VNECGKRGFSSIVGEVPAEHPIRSGSESQPGECRWQSLFEALRRAGEYEFLKLGKAVVSSHRHLGKATISPYRERRMIGFLQCWETSTLGASIV